MIAISKARDGVDEDIDQNDDVAGSRSVMAGNH